jgi:hypothetical protein
MYTLYPTGTETSCTRCTKISLSGYRPTVEYKITDIDTGPVRVVSYESLARHALDLLKLEVSTTLILIFVLTLILIFVPLLTLPGNNININI